METQIKDVGPCRISDSAGGLRDEKRTGYPDFLIAWGAMGKESEGETRV